jgi:hypothetical protein
VPLRRRLLLVLVALAVAVRLPALAAPFLFDDYAQLAMAEGTYPSPRGPLDFYAFIDEGSRAPLVEQGCIPWWSSPQLYVRFLRPLSSALVWADHRLFGRVALLHHLHSLLWWGVAVVAVHALLRRLLSARVARLGTAVFALSPCHAMPLVWLANRDTLLSTALGTFALLAYARWRDGRRPRDGLASLGLWAVALLAGEYTLGFGGYVAAMEVVRRREPLARRAIGIAAFAVPAAAYVAAHVALRYGARGSGFYRDPFDDLGAYLRAAPARLAVLTSEAWLGLDEGSALFRRWWTLALAVCAVGVAAIVLGRAVRRLDEERRRAAVWLLLGSLLALPPVLAVEPAPRLLGVCMVGVSAAVALLLDRVWFPPAPEPRSARAELMGLFALALAFAHLVLGPLHTWLDVRAVTQPAARYERRLAWLRNRLAETRPRTVVIVRADSAQTGLFAPLMLGDAAPDRWRVLSSASGRSLLLRTGPRSVELVQSERPLLPIGPRDLFRPADLHPGDAVELGGMRATVLQTGDEGQPRRLRFEFDEDLESPSMLWIAEGEEGFRDEKPPPPGYGAPVVR